jgi:hypothetical protein
VANVHFHSRRNACSNVMLERYSPTKPADDAKNLAAARRRYKAVPSTAAKYLRNYDSTFQSLMSMKAAHVRK